jgi:predicted MPP superfamily phosphohydrolase
VLTFVHLSDIHFVDRDHGTQFDLGRQIRATLLDDLAAKPSGTAGYDALLITGDIAFSGKKADFERAKAFLEDVFARTGIKPTQTYMVPGNHDVDRDFVGPKLPLWASHESIRKSTHPVEWQDIIYTQLKKDPLHSLLAPLGAYNDFAQGYACDSTPENLAWTRPFEKRLEGDIRVQLHGLNSALISDAADAPGRLLVSEYQTSHFTHAHDTVDVVLCHHPPDWLLDKQHVREVVDGFAKIALFGHEHATRIVPGKTHLQLFAGAVEPSARDAGHWVPTYHILQLSVAGDAERELVVKVHTREFSKSKGYRFHPRLNEEDELIDEHRVRFKRRRQAPPSSIEGPVASIGAAEPASASQGTMTFGDSDSSENEVAQRELLVHFFRLGTPLRFLAATEANLIRDGDDTMEPRVMWAQVFRRAVDEGKLADFWSAVAKHSTELRDRQNPFTR